jgi:hypothetical protein
MATNQGIFDFMMMKNQNKFEALLFKKALPFPNDAKC